MRTLNKRIKFVLCSVHFVVRSEETRREKKRREKVCARSLLMIGWTGRRGKVFLFLFSSSCSTSEMNSLFSGHRLCFLIDQHRWPSRACPSEEKRKRKTRRRNQISPIDSLFPSSSSSRQRRWKEENVDRRLFLLSLPFSLSFVQTKTHVRWKETVVRHSSSRRWSLNKTNDREIFSFTSFQSVADRRNRSLCFASLFDDDDVGAPREFDQLRFAARQTCSTRHFKFDLDHSSHLHCFDWHARARERERESNDFTPSFPFDRSWW